LNATEAVFPAREAVLKQAGANLSSLEQRGSVMLVAILNKIYREFLRASLSGAIAIRRF
jgi:hypothetical protein